MRWMSYMTVATAAGLLAFAGQAQAAVTTYTYVGAFRDGTDVTGVFGAAHRDLTGVGFTAVFTRNDATPGTVTDDGRQTGIFAYVAPAPVRGAITVDGVTWRIRNDFGSQTQVEEKDYCGLGCDLETFNHFTVSSLDANNPSVTLYLHDRSWLDFSGVGVGSDVLTSRDYHTLGDVQNSPEFRLLGQMRIDVGVVRVDGGVLLSESQAFGFLDPTSLTVSTAAPEPGAWALMILGFASAGAMLRRRGRSMAVGQLA